MKKHRSMILIVAMAATAGLLAQSIGQSTGLAGNWRLSLDTPHGTVQGPLKVQQDGSKLTGTYELEHIGSLSLTGTLDGKNVSFSMEVPNASERFTFTGTVEEGKMSGSTALGGSWSAKRE